MLFTSVSFFPRKIDYDYDINKSHCDDDSHANGSVGDSQASIRNSGIDTISNDLDTPFDMNIATPLSRKQSLMLEEKSSIFNECFIVVQSGTGNIIL